MYLKWFVNAWFVCSTRLLLHLFVHVSLIMHALTFFHLHLHDLFLPLVESRDVLFTGHGGVRLAGQNLTHAYHT